MQSSLVRDIMIEHEELQFTCRTEGLERLLTLRRPQTEKVDLAVIFVKIDEGSDFIGQVFDEWGSKGVDEGKEMLGIEGALFTLEGTEIYSAFIETCLDGFFFILAHHTSKLSPSAGGN
jgi:hypothetical protein